MSATPTEISGIERIDDPASPLAALSGFYRAFNAGDLDGLANNWLDGDEPSMSNPIGGIRRGWPRDPCGLCKTVRRPGAGARDVP